MGGRCAHVRQCFDSFSFFQLCKRRSQYTEPLAFLYVTLKVSNEKWKYALNICKNECLQRSIYFGHTRRKCSSVSGVSGQKGH